MTQDLPTGANPSLPALIWIARNPEASGTHPWMVFWLRFTTAWIRRMLLDGASAASSDEGFEKEFGDLARFVPIATENEAAKHQDNTSNLPDLSVNPADLKVIALEKWRALCEQFQDSERVEHEFPTWRDFGKLCFHLAENPEPDHIRPFLFLATFANRINGRARLTYRPLGKAISDAKTANQNEFATGLRRLLQPIDIAAQTNRFLADLVSSRRIFHPVYLDVEEAWHFLEGIPQFEKAGIICKIPEKWLASNNRHYGSTLDTISRVTLNVELGCDVRLSRGAVLDFRAAVAIGQESLTKEEVEQLICADGPLQRVRGKWVILDRDRLRRLREIWQGVIEPDFSEALRWSSQYDVQLNTNGDDQLGGKFSNTDVLRFNAGPALQSLLENLKNPSPKWPSEWDEFVSQNVKASLRGYQKAGVNWLMKLDEIRCGGCLADDMGLGKTLQILVWLALRKQFKSTRSSGIRGPVLIVVPASLIDNWVAEASRFVPAMNVQVWHSSRKDDSKNDSLSTRSPSNRPDIVVTTYTMIRSAYSEGQNGKQNALLTTGWSALVLDEAQAIKNPDTQLFAAMQLVKSDILVALTGTPIENSLRDLWSIFSLSFPGLLGSLKDFEAKVKELRAGEDGYAPLRRLIAPFILRRRKTDPGLLPELPAKIESIGYCYLSLAQAKLYRQVTTRLVEELGKIGASNAEDSKDQDARNSLILQTIMELKQICNHPSQYLKDGIYLAEASGKFLKLIDLATAIALRGEKLLVFTQFKELTDILDFELAKVFKRKGLVLHGGTPVAERQMLVNRFQAPGDTLDMPPYFVLSLKAGGTGLNLTKAQNVIHFDRWWNPAVENQATDRAWRMGQKSPVLVQKLVCRGTLEEKISILISSKSKLATDVLDDMTIDQGLSLGRLTDQEVLDILTLEENTNSHEQ